jgi:hypothetical protein
MVFFKKKILEKCREYYRNTIFSPASLLQAMDMAGGQLSMQVIEVLRHIETLGNKFYRESILPSSGLIKKACSVVDAYVSREVPFEEGILETGGEYAKFQPQHVIKVMIAAYKLKDVAKVRPI